MFVFNSDLLSNFASRQVHDLENKVNLVEDEKNNIAMEYELFQKKVGFRTTSASPPLAKLTLLTLYVVLLLPTPLQSSGSDPSASSIAGSDSGILSKELKRQLESLQEELFKSEGQRDEASARADVMERQLEESRAKEADMQVST